MLQALRFQASTVDAQAATTGFRTVKGKTYYYKNGKKVKGWLTLNGKKYFLNTRTGVLLKGWQRSSRGPKRYFNKKNGVMYTGMKKIGGKSYYFDIKTGYTKSGFVRSANGAVVRYFFFYFVQLRIAKVKRGQRFQRFSTSLLGIDHIADKIPRRPHQLRNDKIAQRQGEGKDRACGNARDCQRQHHVAKGLAWTRAEIGRRLQQ